MKKENGDKDVRGVNFLLNSAVDWPRSNREGRKIATSRYYESLLEVLDKIDNFDINFNLWKRFLSATVKVARFESFESWALVHRCCRALLDHNEMNESRMNTNLVKVGLQVAELTKDPQLAADIICNIGINRLEDEDGTINAGDKVGEGYEDSNSARHSFPRIPLSTYMKTINVCIEAGHNNSADRILRHCMQNKIPSNTLSNMYSLVLNGYAQRGDLQSTEKLFGEMKEKGLVQRYVVMLHNTL